MRRRWMPTYLVAILALLPSTASSVEQEENLPAKLRARRAEVRKAARDKVVKHRKKLVSELLEMLRDPALRTENRAATALAIELLGEIRAREAVGALAGFLLYGRRGDIHDQAFLGKARLPPHKAAPAVQALIEISIPSLKPVTDVLLAITDDTKDGSSLALHCLWIIGGVLGPRLGHAYIHGLIEAGHDSRFLRDGLNFMKISMEAQETKASFGSTEGKTDSTRQ